jgi:hypothetical protein
MGNGFFKSEDSDMEGGKKGEGIDHHPLLTWGSKPNLDKGINFWPECLESRLNGA